MGRDAIATSMFLFLAAHAALAQDQTQTDKRIEQLERELQDLKKKVNQDQPTGKDFLSTIGSVVKVYGFLRLDAIYDDSRPNDTQVIAYVRSEDSSAGPAIGAKKNDEDLTIHGRLTRLGLDFDGGKVTVIDEAALTGKLEFDFYNLPSSDSRAAVRMRHAWLKLNWGEFSLLAGQREDVIAPIFPIVNADLVMWGAGNLGDRRPQIRPEWSDGTFTVTGMVGLTGANDQADIDSDGFLDGEDSGLPTLQLRLGASFNGWVEKKKFTVGVWGHRAWEETSTPIAGKDEFDSTAVGIDFTLPILTNLWLKGEAWRGKNVDDVRGGIFQGINSTTGDEVASEGGFVELGWQPLSWYSPSIGFSMDNPDHDDLPATGRDMNRTFYLANRFTSGPVDIGFDILHWETDYAGYGKGTDNRYYLFFAYRF